MHVDISGSDIDGVVSVYYGTSLGSLLELAGNVPIDGVRPDFVQFAGKKGKTYRIVVASLDSDDLGYIRLRAEVNGQPDINPPYVTVISPPNGLVTTEKRVELIGSAVDPSPNSSGIWEVSVRVNKGIGVTAVGAEEWSIPVVLSEGLNRIEVFAVDYSSNVSKPFRMEFDYRAPDVPNDHFSNATQMNRDRLTADGSQTQFALSQAIADVEEILVKVNGRVVGAAGYEVFGFNSRVLVMAKPPARGAEVEVFHPVWTSQPVNTDKATRETGEPEHAGNEGGGSVWWVFTAPYDGLLNVRTVNTGFDTVMGAYVGTRVNKLRLVTSNDDDPALAELEEALDAVLLAFRIGRNSLLSRFFAPRADRIMFAATKADHLHHRQHARLTAIMQAMLHEARARADFKGATTAAMSDRKSTRLNSSHVVTP